MGQTVVNVGSFDLTSHNGNTAYSSVRYFDIPANNGITSCVATFATHVNTGDFQGKSFSLNSLQAHPNTPWPTSGIALNPALLSAGQNAFRAAVKSQADLSARWSIGDIYLTIDYTDVPTGGGGSPPPPNIGAVTINKTTLVAGDTITVSASASDAGFNRSVYLMLADNTVISTIAYDFGTAAGSWTIEVPASLFAAYAAGSEILILNAYMDVYQTGTYVGSDAKNFTVNIPSAGSISVPSSFTAGQTLSVPISAAGAGVSRRVGIYDSSGTLIYYLANVAGAESGTLIYNSPTSLCSTYAPDATYFNVTVRMEPIISGTIVYGTVEKTLRIDVPASAVPTIGAFTATRNANGVDASITNYVQNYSKVNLAMGSVAGALGSSIVSYEITGGGFSAAASSSAMGPFAQTGDITFTAKVTDTRGRTGTKAVTINVLAYSAVSGVNLLAYRSNGSMVADDEGAYATLRGRRVFSSLDGQNAAIIKGRVYEKDTTAPGWTNLTDDTLTLFGGGLLSQEKGYTAEIAINDKITAVVYVFQIPTAIVGIHIMPGATGGGFGMYGQPNRWDFHKPVYANDIILTSSPNPNLLDNAGFRNPVNQRGASGLIDASTPGYGIDRWRFVGAYVNSENVSIYPQFGCYLEQKLEPIYQALYGKTVTVSMYTNVGYISASGVFPASGFLYLSLTPDNLWRAELISNYGDGRPGVRFHVIQYPNAIYAIKLELGAASTLHLDPPADYGVELAKCQRYCLKVDGYVARSLEYYSTGTRFLIPTPVTMRVVPSLESGSLQWWSTSAVQIPITAMQISLSNFGVPITLSTTSSGVDGMLIAVNAILSADL